MARQTLTKTTATATGFPTAGVSVTMTAEDVSNHSAFVNTGKELVVVHNTHAATPYTFTVTGTADQHGFVQSTVLVAEAIVAQAIKIVGPFSKQLPGWTQTDGTVQLDASNASVKFGVITLP